VVAGFSILGDWARAVAGGDASVAVLVGPEGDLHAHEPSPADGRAVADADLVVEIGLGFQPWLDKMLRAAPGARVLPVSEGMTLRKRGTEADPHVWGDPANAVFAVEKLRDAFAAADAAHAAGYRSRAAAYVEELRALDGWIRAETARVPPARRVLFTTHDTLGYWADRYGFRVEETILDSFSTEAADPSAARLARLADRVKAAGAPVFMETTGPASLARTLARSAGAGEPPRLYTDALGKPGTPGDTYLHMMRHNTAVIVDALAAAAGAR
jgi:ABC-type Zn uptake system ZnuABC Zn-binding protein ZnuA